MKKFTLILPLVSLAVCSHVSAQTESLRNFPSFEPTKHIRLDLSGSYGKGTNLNTIQLTKFRNLDKDKMFSIGAGFRLNNLNYSNQTMKAEGSNMTGFDSFRSSGIALGLNFMVSAEFNWNNKWCFGVNTDLAGLGFGIADVSEDYTVRKDVRREYEISPFNLGTIVHDINVRSGINSSTGVLNTEVYGAYKLGRKIWIKAGYSRLNADILLKKVEEKFGYNSHLLFLGARFTY